MFVRGYTNAALCDLSSFPLSLPPPLGPGLVNLQINGSQFSNIVARTNFNWFQKQLF